MAQRFKSEFQVVQVVRTVGDVKVVEISVTYRLFSVLCRLFSVLCLLSSNPPLALLFALCSMPYALPNPQSAIRNPKSQLALCPMPSKNLANELFGSLFLWIEKDLLH